MAESRFAAALLTIILLSKVDVAILCYNIENFWLIATCRGSPFHLSIFHHMAVFPGVGTLAERKKFAIFHACTLVIAPIIGALILFIINWYDAKTTKTIRSSATVIISLNPLTDEKSVTKNYDYKDKEEYITIIISLSPLLDAGKWLLFSMLVWNIIGSIRLCSDFYDKLGSGSGTEGLSRFYMNRFFGIFIMLFFPFYYLYNLWCIFAKREGNWLFYK
jgi:hypothetical protein